jgi:general secretion pathway protein D
MGGGMMGGMGGGMGGFGRGMNGFSAGGTGGQNGMTFGAPLFEAKELPGTPLTPDQIATLQARASVSGRGQEGVTSEEVQDVTSREPLIYVSHNKTHSLVIIRTSDEKAMKSIEHLVMDLDRPTPEVLLEMKILKVRLQDDFKSVLDIQYTSGPLGPDVATQSARNPFLVSPPATAAENVLGLVNAQSIGGSFVYQYLSDNLRARLQLLQEQQCVTSIASPVLLSSNNRPARIFVGKEQVMTVGFESGAVTPATGATTTFGQPETEVVDVGTQLVILPKINADRSVTLSLYENQSKIDPDATSIPIQAGNGEIIDFPIDSLLTSNIEATVVAHDGLTIAVGGLISDETTIVERRVPGLHRLPLIGNLFRQYTDENEKSELILLITPHVITTAVEGQYKSQARIQALSDHPNIGEYSGGFNQLGYEGKVTSGLHHSPHEWDETEKPSWRSESDVEEVEEIPSP